MEVKSRSEDPPPLRRVRPRPEAVSFPPTVPLMVERSARLFGERTFLPRRHSRGGEPISFERLERDVRSVAAGLLARGLVAGDRIGLMAENRYEWFLADLGTTYFGGVDVPRGADTAPAEMQFILRHSGSRFVFVEGDRLAQELLAHRHDLPALEGLCTLDETTAVDGVIRLPELMAQGDAWARRNRGGLDALADRVHADDLLTLVYTSGTTAEPKGVMLTHGNVLSNVRTANQVFDFGPADRLLSVLPPWHIYERMLDYVALAFGAEMVYTDRRRIKDDLAAVQPTTFAAVPRIWESLHDGIVASCQKLPPRKRAVMQRVLETCRRIGAGQPTLLDRCLHPILRATVLRKFQRVTGGRMRIAVSGGGALPAHVDQTLVGLGLPLLNGYGLTETSPVVSVRRPGSNCCGTIGPPLPETDVQIRDESGRVLPPGKTGLIWIRGPGVMRGYYNNPERTGLVLVDGWFNSGDLGSLRPDGQIRITGRAKDTIVLASGENVEPEHIETAIKMSPYIEQAVVLGQDCKTLSALLVPAQELVERVVPRARWGIQGDLVNGEEVRGLLRQELDLLLSRERGFRATERIAAFRVLHEPMTPDNGCLTPTLKVKRHVVHERYRDVIAGMLGGE